MYQIIELTVNYYKYETVIDIRSEKPFNNFPATTFCYKELYENPPNHLSRHHERINHKTIAEYIFKSINCTFQDFIYSNREQCKSKTEIVASIGSSQSCITFFSQLYDSYNITY